jgi:methyl-accepting chemotaxis protein
MSPVKITLVKKSWAKVKPISSKAAKIFYATLFEKDPAIESLFNGDMKVQGKKLMSMIGNAVDLLDDLDSLIPVLHDLGRKHAQYGVESAHYDTVGAALLETLATGLGDDFNDDVKTAWTEVYGILAATMIGHSSVEPEKVDTDVVKNDTYEPDALASTGPNNSNTELTEEHTMSNKVDDNNTAFLKGAIEQSGTASLMVDRDLIITYANPASLKILKKHEATFQRKYPGFSAAPEAIMGTCIDTFHSNPAHQRKILDNPSNLPWNVDITIEDLKFSLNVTAIMAEDGSNWAMHWNGRT